MKQFAPAYDRNRAPIVSVLREILPVSGRVLEIGSGTGQHVNFFAGQFPSHEWQPTDLVDNLETIGAWTDEADHPNVRPAAELNLLSDQLPAFPSDVIVCINTVHIVAWRGVERLMAYAGEMLAEGGLLYLYGPFKYRDRPLEPSNAEFDQWLKRNNPASGVREMEAIDELARQGGLSLRGDQAMPSNNRSIWWQKAELGVRSPDS